ncbi:MAG: RidA family protein [Phycisphaerales bacterium JB059]
MSQTPEDRLRELGLELPAPPRPVAAYIPAKRFGNLVQISGQIPMRGGKLMATGVVPSQVGLAEAVACARQCALNGLAVLRAEIGELSGVRNVVRLGGFVAADPWFADHPEVINGASELMLQVFGERGRHARAAVGVASLPLNATVEIEFLFEVG